MQRSILLCHLHDIPDGSARGFDPGGVGRDTVFVVRRGDCVHGWYDQCPHEGLTPLPYRRHHYLNKAGNRIVCFAHGALFEIDSGQCVRGPCLGQALRSLPLTLLKDGRIMAVEEISIAQLS
ncbi:MAG: Rieske 2Fe-2S domain-containing protein [Giesbergeria sp.]|uniref:Rieske (2Fe-2S) protein n=1 Tax=Giesbergeria sp. TaxID=2818473 RepID=UPI00261810CC|nr:Rieske 2Fe-2S domain-containing protein [Giesbergeria sp.]MDD2610229.1 Rieske 2Fe-2S domain-containing protein [Giesbergeria sp.]